MQVCQVCQHQNPAGVEYCEECGASLAASTSGAPTPPPATSAPTPAVAAAPPPPSPSVAGSAQAGAPIAAGADASAAAGGSPAVPTSQPPAGAPTPAGGQPRLVSKRYGALTGEEIPLLGERLVVGRFDPETGPVDIDLSSIPETQHISRQHGELYREADGRWFVRDLGSTNGVFVKRASDASFGQRITQPREIANGDEVAFGNARFVFRLE